MRQIERVTTTATKRLDAAPTWVGELMTATGLAMIAYFVLEMWK